MKRLRASRRRFGIQWRMREHVVHRWNAMWYETAKRRDQALDAKLRNSGIFEYRAVDR